MSGHRVVRNANGHFYSATKYAVSALLEGIRNELLELKSHIRVTVKQFIYWLPPPPLTRDIFSIYV